MEYFLPFTRVVTFFSLLAALKETCSSNEPSYLMWARLYSTRMQREQGCQPLPVLILEKPRKECEVVTSTLRYGQNLRSLGFTSFLRLENNLKYRTIGDVWCWACSSVRISSFGDLRHWLEAVDPVDVWYPIQSVESSGNGVFNSSPIIRKLDGRMRGQDITLVVDVNCSPYDNTHFLLVWKRNLHRIEISWQCWGHQNRKCCSLLLNSAKF